LIAQRLHRCKLQVLRSGMQLVSVGSNAKAPGLVWRVGRGHGMPALPSRDLGDGTAGAVISLATLYAGLGDERLREAAIAGLQWLDATDDSCPSLGLPGLFVGEAGVSLSFLVAGDLLDRPKYRMRALEMARQVYRYPICSPDLYHGSAGRLLLHLRLWEDLRAPDQLDSAAALGELLTATACNCAPHSIAWPIPPEYGALTERAYLGFAHGISGIGYVLCRLYESTQDDALLDTVDRIAETLIHTAVLSKSGGGIAWPLTVDEQSPVPPMWCHGACGIGRFFLIADRIGLNCDCLRYVVGAAEAVGMAPWLGPSQCHGLAGSVDFLLDVHERTGEVDTLRDARRLAAVLAANSQLLEDGISWSGRDGVALDHSLWPGYGGIGQCLLRVDGAPVASLHSLLFDG